MVGPRAAGVVEREIDGCYALFNPGSELVVVLNETASDIWRLVDDGALTLDAIAALLARAYGVDPEEIRDDVSRAVASLREGGFLAADDE